MPSPRHHHPQGPTRCPPESTAFWDLTSALCCPCVFKLGDPCHLGHSVLPQRAGRCCRPQHLWVQDGPFPVARGASRSLDVGGHVCAPPLLLDAHTCVLSPHSHAHVHACLYVHTCSHITRPRSALTHTLTRPRSVAALRGGWSVPELEGRSLVSQTPRARSAADSPTTAWPVFPSCWSPSPGRGLSAASPRAFSPSPSVRHGGSGQPPRRHPLWVMGARASPTEELSARVPSGQSGPSHVPLTALRWVPGDH